MTVLRMKRGDTLTIDFDASDSIAGATVTFTAKARIADTTPVFSGSTVDGRVVVTDAAAGTGTVTIPPSETTGFTRPRSLYWDIQLSNPGQAKTIDEGMLFITLDVTT